MLLVLWQVARNEAGESYVTFPAAAQIYCTYAVMAIASIAAVRCATKPPARYAIALLASALWLAAVTTPFWINGLVLACPQQSRQTVVAWALLGNPFYSVLSAVVERTAFVWHQWGLLYRRITEINNYGPPPVPWYAAACRYGMVAAGLWTIALVRQRRGRRRLIRAIDSDGSADRQAAPQTGGRPGPDG